MRSRLQSIGFGACALSALATGRAWGQAASRWAQPVTGSYTDPAMWSGPVPIGVSRDAVIDAAAAGSRYNVNTPDGGSVTTGHVAVGAADAQLNVLGSFTAAGGIDLNAGWVWLNPFSRLDAPFVHVAPGAFFYIDGNYDIRLSTPVLRGMAIVRAPLQVERDLALDNGRLQVERNGITFLNGSRLSGNGTVFFGQDNGGYLRPSDGSTLTIDAGITVTGTHPGRVENAVNYGTFRTGAANRASLELFGVNHGTLSAEPGGSYIAFHGTNESDGVITAVGDPTTRFVSSLNLYNLTNRGTITATNTTVSLFEGLTNNGTIRLTDSTLNVSDTFTTASLSQVQFVGPQGITRIFGTLDNRGQVINLDTFGALDFSGGATLLGGRVSGSDANASRLTFSGPNFVTLQGVTLDVPVSLADSAGPLQVRDGITVNRSLDIFNRRNLMFVNSGTLGGAGQVTISGNRDSGIAQEGGTTITIAPGMTVKTLPNSVPTSGGFVGSVVATDPADHVSLINRGRLVAGAGSFLTISGRNWKNEGSIALEPNSTLNLGGTFKFSDLGTVERNGQRVNFASDLDITGQTFDLNVSPIGPLDLGSSSFVGGQLVAPGRVVRVRQTDNHRDGLVINGTVLALDLDLESDGDLISVNDVRLDNATVRLKGQNSQVRGLSVTGTGQLIFDAPTPGAPGPRVVAGLIGPGVTVSTGVSSGEMFLGNAFESVINDGHIVSGQPGKSISFQNPLNNRSVVEATAAGASVLLRGGGVNQPAAVIRASAGGAVEVGFQRTLNNLGTLSIAPGASLDVDGTLKGDGQLDVRGVIRPGGAFVGTGTIDLPSTLQFQSSTTLAVQLQATRGFAAADRLDVTGDVDLAGTLRVDTAEGFPILPHESFKVLRFGSRTGDFDRIVNNTGYAGLTFTPVYDDDSLSLTTGALNGDANLDGRVNGSDVLLVRRNLGRAGPDWLSGDLNADGLVNVRDLQIARANVGAQLPGLGATLAGVPEPGAATLVMGASLLTLRRRTRRPIPPPFAD